MSLAENGCSNFDEVLLINFFILIILQLILSLRTLCLPYILQISFLLYFSKAFMIVHVNPLTILIEFLESTKLRSRGSFLVFVFVFAVLCLWVPNCSKTVV